MCSTIRISTFFLIDLYLTAVNELNQRVALLEDLILATRSILKRTVACIPSLVPSIIVVFDQYNTSIAIVYLG